MGGTTGFRSSFWEGQPSKGNVRVLSPAGRRRQRREQRRWRRLELERPAGMHKTIETFLTIVREAFLSRAAFHTEILALRQQVTVLKRERPRPSLRMVALTKPFRLPGAQRI